MSKLNELPYAQWLEDSLSNVIKSNTQSICIMTKNDNGEIGSGYFNCSVADKILFAGFINHDATIESLAVNGYIDDCEDEDEEDFDMEEDELE